MAKTTKKLSIDQKLDSLIKFVKTDSAKQNKRTDTLETLLESLANFTTSNFHRVDNQLTTIVKRLDIQQDDITDIKRMITQLVQSQASRDRFEIDTDRRLNKVEKHLKFA